MELSTPSITWFVKKPDDEAYEENNDFYAGSYNQAESLQIDFLIWNNRYGTEKVEDLENFGITMSFDHEEDSALLKYCQFLLNSRDVLIPDVVGNEATIQIPENIVISGDVNDGTLKCYDNYITLKMVLDVPADSTLKMNDLKGVTFSITNL